MKKLALLPILLAFSAAVAAQEKYVEVVVSDTLLVEPQEWFVHLNIEKKYDYSTMTDTVVTYSDTVVSTLPPRQYSQPVELPGTSLAQLRDLVKKYGGRVIIDSMSAINNLVSDHNENGRESSYLNVSFNNRKSLEGFLHVAGSLGDVESQITGTVNPKIQDYQFLLEKKLMNAARLKATRLADLGSSRIGSVLLISEVVESESSWLKNFIETMVKLDFDRKSYARFLNTDKIRIEKSLKVRFALL